MTPTQFKSWRLHMKLSKKRAAEALALSQSSVDLYERGHTRGRDCRAVTIPQTVALACAALALGISDYQGPA